MSMLAATARVTSLTPWSRFRLSEKTSTVSLGAGTGML